MKMSQWTHAICNECWNRQRPDNQVDLNYGKDDGEQDTCCWCGKVTYGIYIRAQSMVGHKHETK